MKNFENINIKDELEGTLMIEKLILKLRQASHDKYLKIFSQNNYPQDDFTNNLIQHETGFKYAQSTKKLDYHYFVSNLGRLMLVKWENPNKKDILKNEIFNYPHWFFKFDENGHDIINNPPLDIAYDKHTDLYKFVASAWLKEEKLEEDYHCHHINNDPNDNRTVNLIYLRKDIHLAI